MKIEDAALMNFLWAWEVMRRIGFAPAEIMMVIVPPGGTVKDTPSSPARIYDRPVIACVVRRGAKEFKWIVGPTTIPDDKLSAAYEEAVTAWNNGTIEGAEVEDFRKSVPFRMSTTVLMLLNQKGML